MNQCMLHLQTVLSIWKEIYEWSSNIIWSCQYEKRFFSYIEKIILDVELRNCMNQGCLCHEKLSLTRLGLHAHVWMHTPLSALCPQNSQSPILSNNNSSTLLSIASTSTLSSCTCLFWLSTPYLACDDASVVFASSLHKLLGFWCDCASYCDCLLLPEF